jgi:hypothetical protein
MSEERQQGNDAQWPTTRLDGNTIFFDDLWGKRQIIVENSERMFEGSESIRIEACMINEFGALYGKLSSEGC